MNWRSDSFNMNSTVYTVDILTFSITIIETLTFYFIWGPVDFEKLWHRFDLQRFLTSDIMLFILESVCFEKRWCIEKRSELVSYNTGPMCMRNNGVVCFQLHSTLVVYASWFVPLFYLRTLCSQHGHWRKSAGHCQVEKSHFESK